MAVGGHPAIGDFEPLGKSSLPILLRSALLRLTKAWGSDDSRHFAMPPAERDPTAKVLPLLLPDPRPGALG